MFAARSPERPNPIAVSNAAIAYVDEEKGVVGLYWIDALDGTPVLDLKPYTPGIDRIERPRGAHTGPGRMKRAGASTGRPSSISDTAGPAVRAETK